MFYFSIWCRLSECLHMEGLQYHALHHWLVVLHWLHELASQLVSSVENFTTHFLLASTVPSSCSWLWTSQVLNSVLTNYLERTSKWSVLLLTSIFVVEGGMLIIHSWCHLPYGCFLTIWFLIPTPHLMEFAAVHLPLLSSEQDGHGKPHPLLLFHAINLTETDIP